MPYFVRPNGTILPLEVDGMVPTLTSARWEINGVVAPVLGRSDIMPSPLRIGFRRNPDHRQCVRALVGDEPGKEEVHVEHPSSGSDGEDVKCCGEKKGVSEKMGDAVRDVEDSASSSDE